MARQKQLRPELQKWYDRGSLLQINGNNIFYIDEGDATLPVIVLIHGFPSSSWDFAEIWDQLRISHRVVCLDMLGFGFSDKPDRKDYEIHKQADLFEALIDHLHLSEFHVLAHDYGVSVAQEMLARKLENQEHGILISCCLLNGGLFPETHKALLLQRLLLSPIGRWVNLLNGFSVFSKAFASVFGENTKPTRKQLVLFWQLITYNNGRHIFHNLITYILDRREYSQRWRSALQNSPVPMALINGSKDPISGEHLVKRYQQLNCRLDYLAELPEVGHYPQFEDPEQVFIHYQTFITQVIADLNK